MTTIPVHLPELGTAGQEVRIGYWFVEAGEEVDAGDRLVELLLPGITFDVPAPAAGRILRIEKPADRTARTGDVLGWIESGGGEDAEQLGASETGPPGAQA